MGILKCKKHGYTGFYETCEHVNEEFTRGIYPIVYYIKYLNMLICGSCWEKYDLEELKKCIDIWDKYYWDVSEETPGTDRYWEIYDLVDRKIWCGKCVAELNS